MGIFVCQMIEHIQRSCATGHTTWTRPNSSNINLLNKINDCGLVVVRANKADIDRPRGDEIPAISLLVNTEVLTA